MNQTEIQEHKTALRELGAEANSPEEAAILKEWQTELDEQRQAAEAQVGNKAIRLVQMPDGSLATEAEASQILDGDSDTSHPYKNGRRG